MTGPATASKPEKTALEKRLIELIRQRGPIRISDYMADALTHPHEGYYTTRMPLGADGDFTTAPEVSQLFGELIGLWLVQSWIDLGSPSAFNLVELGPGRGTLMADILRVARLRPAFLKAANIWLVEMSGRLRYEQKKKLGPFDDAKITWADRFTDIPPGPTLIIANEFFDCLPIRQFVFRRTGWHERLVGTNRDHSTLTFVEAPAPERLDHPLAIDPAPLLKGSPRDESAPVLPDVGTVLELNESATAMAGEIAAFLADNRGRALIIDYGHASCAYGESLQSVRNHEFWPPLEAPGAADLTAHVDFGMLTRAAIDAGACVYGPQTQGNFLDRLGIAFRLEALSRGKNEDARAEIAAGADRLTNPAKMGSLFKVLVVASPLLDPPAGFEGDGHER